MRAKIAAGAALLAVLWAAPAATKPVESAPRPNEIFPLLLADQRAVQLGAQYYRSASRDLGELSLGHAWGLWRDRQGSDLSFLSELDLEAMARTRFGLSGGARALDAADLFAALPYTTRRGPVSFKGLVYHESSHLGDDYIRRTGRAGERSEAEGFRGLAALEPWEPLRAYGGAGWAARRLPATPRWELQFGAELTSPELDWPAGPPTRAYLAQDFQSRGRVGYNLDSHTVVGLRFGRGRSARAQVGYFAGHSSFGQFAGDSEHRFDAALVLEL